MPWVGVLLHAKGVRAIVCSTLQHVVKIVSRFTEALAFLSPCFQSETYQEDIYPMTPGTEPALTPDEWLSGVNRGKATGAALGGRHGAPKTAGQWDGTAALPDPLPRSAPLRSHPDVAEGGLQEDIQNCL